MLIVLFDDYRKNLQKKSCTFNSRSILMGEDKENFINHTYFFSIFLCVTKGRINFIEIVKDI